MKPNQRINPNSWNILIVDDKKDIHSITINAFFEEKVYEKELNFLSAYTEAEAKNILDIFHNQIDLILLDEVLDHNGDEGINILKYLVNELKNNMIPVILRTGYVAKLLANNISVDFPQVLVLEKGETDVEKLIKIVSEALTKDVHY